MTQATTAPPTAIPVPVPAAWLVEGEHRFAIHGVSWEQYEQILATLGDHPQRIAYCEGTIELMSPGPWHEKYGYLLGRMVDILTEELDIPMVGLGSTTLRRQAVERGLEADRTYYSANAHHLTGADHLDLETTPPPDLAIEVEITSSILNKLSIYAGLRVPELWRHDGQALRVYLLQADGTYAESPTSRAFPFLPMPAFARKLDEIDPTNDTRWAKAFLAWVREGRCAAVSTLISPDHATSERSHEHLDAIAAAPIAQSRADPSAGESRFLIHCLDWDGYQKLLELFGDDGPRVSYLNGVVELMSPHFPHEGSKKILGRMVEELTAGLRIRARALGSSTFFRRDVERGVEADECYYLTNIERLRGQRKGDLDVVPPPDLVIEVEITSPLLDKLAIYAGLGFPEIWRYDGERLTVLLLQADGSYAESPRSRAFPFLPWEGFAAQLAAHDPENETEWIIGYRDWVREVVAPLYQP